MKYLQRKENNMKFIIKDWAGNICFKGITFEDFEDAWDWLMAEFPEASDSFFEDYFVEEEK